MRNKLLTSFPHPASPYTGQGFPVYLRRQKASLGASVKHIPQHSSGSPVLFSKFLTTGDDGRKVSKEAFCTSLGCAAREADGSSDLHWVSHGAPWAWPGKTLQTSSPLLF